MNHNTYLITKKVKEISREEYIKFIRSLLPRLAKKELQDSNISNTITIDGDKDGKDKYMSQLEYQPENGRLVLHRRISCFNF